MKFVTGPDEETDLTDRQIIEELKMYHAATRIADRVGCAAIGIQYQLGLKDICVASDLAEGLLNNPNRPPVKDAEGRILYEGLAIPHFNEVDECSGLDAIMTNRIWTEKRMDPSTTLHDVRWGEHYKGDKVDEFVWVFQISGGAPASHFIGGYTGAISERQLSMYFPLGGGTLKGISKPGEIVWSRIYIEDNKLHMDIGRGGVVKLPQEETQRRWNATTPQWPIMHAIIYGISRDQFMARHKANHIQVVYADNAEMANQALFAKASMAQELGLAVHFCGELNKTLN
jgi:L-fucose isomerase-like protein